ASFFALEDRLCVSCLHADLHDPVGAVPRQDEPGLLVGREGALSAERWSQRRGRLLCRCVDAVELAAGEEEEAIRRKKSDTLQDPKLPGRERVRILAQVGTVCSRGEDHGAAITTQELTECERGGIWREGNRTNGIAEDHSLWMRRGEQERLPLALHLRAG